MVETSFFVTVGEIKSRDQSWWSMLALLLVLLLPSSSKRKDLDARRALGGVEDKIGVTGEPYVISMDPAETVRLRIVADFGASRAASC